MSEVKKEKKVVKKATRKATNSQEEKKTSKKIVKAKEKTIKEEKKETKAITKEVKVKKEEIKEKALLTEKEQINCKGLCKTIKILAKIGKIALMIFVPFIFLTMIIIPFVFKNFEISANIIKLDDISMIVNNDKVSIKIGDSVHVLKCNADVLNNITSFLTENSKSSIVTFIELSLLLFAVVLILDLYILMYLEKLFDNFITKKTPFIKENTNYIFKIALFICAVKFISICLSVANIGIFSFDSFSIIEILIIFAIYFIFKYAVLLQSKSDSKIYD